MHHILDGTFLDPRNTLWPIFGGFESTDYEIVEWLYAFLKPYVIIEEMIGLSVLLLVAYRFGLLDIAHLKRLARTGRLGPKRTQ